MYDAFAADQPRGRTSRARLVSRVGSKFRKARRYAADGHRTQDLAVPRMQHADRRFAYAHRLFQHRVEYRGEIAGGGIDDLQYFGGRSLLPQGFVTFGGGFS